MKNNYGLTLVELLIVLTIGAIVILFSVSSLRGQHRKNELEIKASELRYILYFSRTQSLIHNKKLRLVPISKDWSKGIRLLKSADSSEANSIIHEWHWPDQNIKISWNGFQSVNHIIFATELHRSTCNGYFLLESNKQQLKLPVNRLGRVHH